MKVKKWDDTEAAKGMAQRYPYVLLQELSRVYLGETDRANIRWEEVTEARFFNDTSELRFWEQDGQLFAVQLEEEEEAEEAALDTTEEFVEEPTEDASLDMNIADGEAEEPKDEI